MTDRAEIERLLNQTGRTLEGLPERYDIVRWNRAANMPGAPLDIICHQSDVIELLVGALRDALAIRDTAVSDLKLISHCFTCANRRMNESGWCINSGGGGAPFMMCPGYIWDEGREQRWRKDNGQDDAELSRVVLE